MHPVSLKDLLEAGCHFGHRTERWNPKAEGFIYQARDGIHVIDLAQTKACLERAAQRLYDAGKSGENVLFVGSKRQAKQTVKTHAERVGAPYLVERWIGGFITNWDTVHRNLQKIRKMEEEKQTGAWNKFPKHERLKLDRYLNRLKRTYGGVIELFDLPRVVYLADIRKEKAAVAEARRCGIAIIGIVDTNSDPTPIDYPIPSNDDAVGAIAYITQYLASAYGEGVAVFAKDQAAKKLKEQKEQEQAAAEQAAAADDETAEELEQKIQKRETSGKITQKVKSQKLKVKSSELRTQNSNSR